jgi:hypothetical protein
MNGNDISYLKRGNHRQRQAYTALHSLDLFNRLAEFNPLLAGAIPLSIDTFESDLDILCFARDLPAFSSRLRELFGARSGFELKTKEIRGVPAVVARFEHAGFPIEIFAQPLPVEQQNGYRHMLVEHRLLALGGDEMAVSIRELKLSGLKTEPAFAQYLRLDGDPYQAVLNLQALDDGALRKLVKAATPPDTP